MITCLGLIVGIVENNIRVAILEQCANFLKVYTHLLALKVSFRIDGEVYATLIDYYTKDDKLWVLFRMHDGYSACVSVQTN